MGSVGFFIPDVKDRKVDLMYWEKSKYFAETVYQFPKNAVIEMLPKDELIESEFGVYQISVLKFWKYDKLLKQLIYPI